MQNASSLHPTRQLLLDSGLAMARQTGLRGLTVRGLCQQAGVNTGSFVYHFGNRESYLSELIESWYTPLFDGLQARLVEDGAPLARLRAMLGQLMAFAAGEGGFISQLIMDAVAGETAVQVFIAGLAPRHPRLLLQCLEQAQQAGEIDIAPPVHQFMFLMSALGFPVLMSHLIGGKPGLPALLHYALEHFAAEPDALQQRLEWAIRGLTPQERKA